MPIEILDDKKEWNDFIRNYSFNSFLFHEWDFLKTVEYYTKTKLLPYGVYKGKELIGVIPVFLSKKMGMHFLFSPPPKTLVPYLGVVIHKKFTSLKQNKKESLFEEIISAFNKEINYLKPSYLTMRLTPEIYDIRGFLWGGYLATPLYTYWLDLNISLEELWINIKKSARWGARKYLENNNLSIRRSRDTTKFVEMLKKRYLEQGLSFPAISLEYLSALISKFSGNIEVYYIVDSSDNLITSKVIIKYGDFYLNWLGDFKIEGYPGLQEWITWEFIKKAKDEGYKIYDMVGADVKRISKFKNQFNPQLKLHFRIEKYNVRGRVVKWTYSQIQKPKGGKS